ncbi:hypothetical protein ANCDUO_18074 [Ancylostoma duodenale]|uniref:Uncharacterized protein n=1 Tax=Ancylostoma duodenale TaxID=51022 RepID=A0A0C2FYT3_9BILA|nr:hypothetical protein ANCDUO_18074 [Ancylostoma duodenale]
MRSSTTSTNSTIGLSSIFATAQRAPRVQELPTDDCLTRPSSLDPARPQRGAARAAGNYRLMSELAKRCREAEKEDLKERRAAVLAEAAEGGKPNDSNFNLCMMPTKEQVEATPGTPLTKGMPE